MRIDETYATTPPGIKIPKKNAARRYRSTPLEIRLLFAYDLAAGFLAAASRIVLRTLLGTCSNVSGSME
jgi:hypothetical protein